jgi:IS605 OrfB family transposase
MYRNKKKIATVAAFQDGTTVRGDLLIGCDGVHSRTRQLIDPAFSGPVYTGLMNTGGYTDGLKLSSPPETTHFIFGKRAFFGNHVSSTGYIYWFANYVQDVGLKQAAVVSDGRKLENQKPFALHVKKLGKLQRKLSKKQKTKDPQTKRTVFSKNYEKQRLKVARQHQQIANIRRDVQHKFTTELARTCGVIGIEDLNILGMMANRKLARAMADAAMGQLLQFLKTKITHWGGDLFIASRWFPSTKCCSCCGQIKKRMPLKHRTYQCLVCGLVMDRDLNAALNLLWFATEQLRQLHAA